MARCCVAFLIIKMLEGSERKTPEKILSNSDNHCTNPGCITSQEEYLPILRNNTGHCSYCEK